MTQLALPLRHPLEVLNAPRGPSDPELWDALLHPDGRARVARLLERRHGTDRAAMRRDLDAFRPPNPIRHSWRPEPQWAGTLAVLRAEVGA